MRCGWRRFRSAFLDLEFDQAVAGETLANNRVVVAAIECQLKR